jgi:mannose-6-phosphate isomerase-like protein (cupin superfamily)
MKVSKDTTERRYSTKDFETVERDGEVFAIIVRARFSQAGVHFFTPDNYSQQLGYMRHPGGSIIQPHVHNNIRREIFYTNEVLFIRSGRIRVDFYGDAKDYLESRMLEVGDVILLVRGGHGFEVIEDAEMIEVKQGPYAGEDDKTRFRTDDGARVGTLVRRELDSR